MLFCLLIEKKSYVATGSEFVIHYQSVGQKKNLWA